MTDSSSYNTPNEIVTRKIVVRFVETGLLPEIYADSLQELLISGTSKPEDWRLLAEKTLESKTEGGKDD